MSPAACVPCGTHAGRSVQPCIRCGSALGHQHVQVADRSGQIIADAPLCDGCLGTIRIRNRPMSEALDDIQVRP